MAYTAHTSVATIHNALAFNHSAILLPKIWLTPAIVTMGRVFYHQPPSLWTSLREQDFDPTHIRHIFSLFSAMRLGALTTRPSYSPKFGLRLP